MSAAWTHTEWARALAAGVAPWIAARPAASNPAGLEFVRSGIGAWLDRLGFQVELHGPASYPPTIVASRAGTGPRTVGLCAHYDVEEAGDGWDTPPFSITTVSDRLFGRGVADNLGPLWLRLAAIERAERPPPPLVVVVQGEEEVGSPGAHQAFPDLALPPIALWLEETGYFELDGTQRLLARGMHDTSSRALAAVVAAAERHGRSVATHDRFLNKAFGAARCPFLTHLVKDAPYLAIGPNDPRSAIHRPNESLPTAHLALVVEQTQELLGMMAGAEV